DVYFLIFSVLIAVALVTVLGMYFYTYKDLEDQMDNQLADLRTRVLVNFNDELEKCLKELQLLDNLGNEDFERLSSQDDKSKEEIAKTREATMQLLPKDEPYPYFGAAVWIDPRGIQRIKWT